VTIEPKRRIFVALDTTNLGWALELARSLRDYVGGMKVGKEFFTALGPEGTEKIVAEGMPLFLDLKFHDIPNTVAGAMRSAMGLKPAIVDVHASGGRAMMTAAVAAAKEESDRLGQPTPIILGVTLLTSMDESDLNDTGVQGGAEDQVMRLASLAHESGLDGVVCSAAEIEPLRALLGPDFKLLTPGIRPTWAAAGDQKRVVTPADAVERGSDYLVIGRPITGADDPVAAAKRIGQELADAG